MVEEKRRHWKGGSEGQEDNGGENCVDKKDEGSERPNPVDEARGVGAWQSSEGRRGTEQKGRVGEVGFRHHTAGTAKEGQQ